MAKACEPFAWHQPEAMPTRLYRDLVEEVTAAVGPSATELLQAVDAALNAPTDDARMLALTAEQAAREAEAWAAARPGEAVEEARARYLRHLAFRHEFAYRRAHGPALFERQSDVVPCPDFLPCTCQQVPARRLSLYRMVNRLWNWGSLLAISGLFPVLLLSVLGALGVNGPTARRIQLIVTVLWAVGTTLFATGYFACRSLRGRP